MTRRRQFERLLLATTACTLFAWAAASCSMGSPSAPATGSGAFSGSASSGSGSGSGSGASGGAGSGATSSGAIGSGASATGVTSGGTSGAAAGSTTAGAAASGAGGSGTVSGSGTAATGGATGASSGGADAGSGATSGTGDAGQGPDEGLAMIDAAGRTPPTCAKNTPPPNEPPAPSRAGECDVLLQTLDFEDMYSYPSPAGSIKVTNFGLAVGLFEINSCSPYCYKKNLTVGLDFVGGGDPKQLQGEIIVDFPATGPGLPITMADMSRNSLAWITFDGAAKPPFEIDTQMIVEASAGVVPSVETKAFFKGNGLSPFGPFSVTNNYSYNNGCEFKYFPFTSPNGFPGGQTNVTGMGFRFVAKATAAQSWHGVAYLDHLQIRGPGAGNPPGAYPFGL